MKRSFKQFLLALSAGTLSIGTLAGCVDTALLSMLGIQKWQHSDIQPAYGVPIPNPNTTPEPWQAAYACPYPGTNLFNVVFTQLTSGLKYPAAIIAKGAGVTVADTVAGDCFLITETSLTPLEASSSLLVKPSALCYDASGSLYVADEGANAIYKIGDDTTALVPLGDKAVLHPRGIATASGSIYISDTGNNRIIKLDALGQATVFAGTGIAGYQDGTDAKFNGPTRLVADTDGTIYVADTGNHRIRRITPDGSVTTLAGTGVAGDSGDGYLALDAKLNTPTGLALDGRGNLYVADTGNHKLRIIKLSSGEIASVGGNGGPTLTGEWQVIPNLIDVCVGGNYLYVLESDKHISRCLLP
jgi:sugar lactone lactonase YvrE